MKGIGIMHCTYCQNLISESLDVCPFCKKTPAYPVRIKKRIIKNRRISPKAYILYIIILSIVTAIGTYMVIDAVDSGNATGAFILVCTIAVVIAFLIHLIDPKPREYSYYS